MPGPIPVAATAAVAGSDCNCGADSLEHRFRAECSDGRLTLHAGTLGDLPLEESSVDAVITTNTVYFVEDLAGAFAEVADERVADGDRPFHLLVADVGDSSAHP